MTKPAEGEPVAWRARNYTEDEWTLLSNRDGRRHYRRVEALYTRPVAWPDREAVKKVRREIFEAMRWANRNWDADAIQVGIREREAAENILALLSASDGAGTAATDLLEAARKADAVLRTMYPTVISDRDAAKVREAFDGLSVAIAKATRSPTHD